MKHPTAAAVMALILVACIAAFVVLRPASAEPTGATILSNTTSGAPVSTPDSRTDARGTITTLVLRAFQQDQWWKGYVGNITGRLVLDDVDTFTIYEWPLSITKLGEVYVSRYNSLTFGNVSCANISHLTAEHAYYGMGDSAPDSINQTFNSTQHQSFIVAGQVIANGTCRTLATYLNDTPQTLDQAQYFQEIALQDNASRIMYVTLINASVLGFDNRTHDFQMIVPESATNASTTYWFWTELG